MQTVDFGLERVRRCRAGKDGRGRCAGTGGDQLDEVPALSVDPSPLSRLILHGETPSLSLRVAPIDFKTI